MPVHIAELNWIVPCRTVVAPALFSFYVVKTNNVLDLMHNQRSAVAEMGDRLATIDMDRKVDGGSCAAFRRWSWVPIKHNVVGAEAYLRTKWHLDPSNRYRQTDKQNRQDNGAVA